MTAGFRLFAIEFRRNAGLWLFAVLLVLVLAISYENYLDGVLLFSQALILLGPAAGGLAAWMAARDRRRGIVDLLATTPKPAPIRDLTLWGATASWVLLAWMAAVAYLLIAAALASDAGDPVVVPILIGLGLLTIAAYAALGYAVGAFVESRSIVALVPLALFLAQLIPAEVLETVTVNGIAVELQNLSTLEALDHHRVPGIAALHAVMLLGLTGIALTAVTLRRRQTRPIWALLVAAAVALAVGATLLLRAEIEASPSFTVSASGDSVCAEADAPGCLRSTHATGLNATAALVGESGRPAANPLVQVPPHHFAMTNARSASAGAVLGQLGLDDGPAITVRVPVHRPGPSHVEPDEAAWAGILPTLAPAEQRTWMWAAWSNARIGELMLETSR